MGLILVAIWVVSEICRDWVSLSSRLPLILRERRTEHRKTGSEPMCPTYSSLYKYLKKCFKMVYLRQGKNASQSLIMTRLITPLSDDNLLQPCLTQTSGGCSNQSHPIWRNRQRMWGRHVRAEDEGFFFEASLGREEAPMSNREATISIQTLARPARCEWKSGNPNANHRIITLYVCTHSHTACMETDSTASGQP